MTVVIPRLPFQRPLLVDLADPQIVTVHQVEAPPVRCGCVNGKACRTSLLLTPRNRWLLLTEETTSKTVELISRRRARRWLFGHNPQPLAVATYFPGMTEPA